MNPIILLHGALGSKSQLEPLKALLEAHGRVVHSLNFSGHSGEPFSSSGFGIDVFAKHLLGYMDKKSIAQADIFGYSMGGYVALWLAYLQPTRIGKIITLGTKFDWSVESADKEVKKLDAEKILIKVPAFARILESRHAPVDWKELLQRTAGMMMGLGQQPLLTQKILSTIAHSITIMLGDQDDMADRSYSEEVADWLPHGKFLPMKDTPHPIEKVNLNMLADVVQG